MPAKEIVNWDSHWQRWEVNHAAAVHGDTMQLCSRFAPIVVVGKEWS
jgi:hypothetical protein